MLLLNSFQSFFTQGLADGFPLEFEWQQVSSSLQPLLSNFADLNNAVVWMISFRPVISKFHSPCTNPWVIVPVAPVIIGIKVTFMFHSFSRALARSWYLSLFSLPFNFTQWSAGTSKPTIWWVHFHYKQYIFFHRQIYIWGCSLGVMVKAMDCRIVVSEFELQSCYYSSLSGKYPWENMNPLILPAMG